MITVDTVRHIARLARMSLSEKEETLYAEQLGKIISYFDELNAIDTTGIEAMSHALHVTNVMREDIVIPSPGHKLLLDGAPAEEDGYFRVPKIGD